MKSRWGAIVTRVVAIGRGRFFKAVRKETLASRKEPFRDRSRDRSNAKGLPPPCGEEPRRAESAVRCDWVLAEGGDC